MWRLCSSRNTFPSYNRSILTEIYLCHACSRQEMLRRHGRGPQEAEEEAERGGESTPPPAPALRFEAEHIRCYFRTPTLMEELQLVCAAAGYRAVARGCVFRAARPYTPTIVTADQQPHPGDRALVRRRLRPVWRPL
jgi:hypothetical protein